MGEMLVEVVGTEEGPEFGQWEGHLYVQRESHAFTYSTIPNGVDGERRTIKIRLSRGGKLVDDKHLQ
jgi:hypothetical protein